ncbi:hypothetical protein IE81DRAFT_368511 [Ceraceosorus guamensis]|uniref:Uncharacterized protein n=1 Tax=Ceraceosorus guamensis TaxID=1522189 RepID=A0A316VRP8_9BASI|nr:hypothetical protein IE81DRAFT_368511 [Ceraceosorus guamensis]PWN40182.1 hypothetical protein IE81DRAFT_368511 [Ceraceosorus guamensis]
MPPRRSDPNYFDSKWTEEEYVPHRTSTERDAEQQQQQQQIAGPSDSTRTRSRGDAEAASTLATSRYSMRARKSISLKEPDASPATSEDEGQDDRLAVATSTQGDEDDDDEEEEASRVLACLPENARLSDEEQDMTGWMTIQKKLFLAYRKEKRLMASSELLEESEQVELIRARARRRTFMQKVGKAEKKRARLRREEEQREEKRKLKTARRLEHEANSERPIREQIREQERKAAWAEAEEERIQRQEDALREEANQVDGMSTAPAHPADGATTSQQLAHHAQSGRFAISPAVSPSPPRTLDEKKDEDVKVDPWRAESVASGLDDVDAFLQAHINGGTRPAPPGAAALWATAEFGLVIVASKDGRYKIRAKVPGELSRWIEKDRVPDVLVLHWRKGREDRDAERQKRASKKAQQLANGKRPNEEDANETAERGLEAEDASQRNTSSRQKKRRRVEADERLPVNSDGTLEASEKPMELDDDASQQRARDDNLTKAGSVLHYSMGEDPEVVIERKSEPSRPRPLQPSSTTMEVNASQPSGPVTRQSMPSAFVSQTQSVPTPSNSFSPAAAARIAALPDPNVRSAASEARVGFGPLPRLGPEVFQTHLRAQALAEGELWQHEPRHAAQARATLVKRAGEKREASTSTGQQSSGNSASPFGESGAEAKMVRIGDLIIPVADPNAQTQEERRAAELAGALDLNATDEDAMQKVEAARRAGLRQPATREESHCPPVEEAENEDAEMSARLQTKSRSASSRRLRRRGRSRSKRSSVPLGEAEGMFEELEEEQAAQSSGAQNPGAEAARDSVPPPSAPLPSHPPVASTPREADGVADGVRGESHMSKEELLRDPHTPEARRSIIRLVEQSPYVPAFLKREVQHFLLRHDQSEAQASVSTQGRAATHQSLSETQEEAGFLPTKKEWLFELERGDARTPYLVLALLTDQQQQEMQADQPGLDYELSTLDEESVRQVYSDPDYDPWLDKNGHLFVVRGFPAPVACAGAGTDIESFGSASLANRQPTSQSLSIDDVKSTPAWLDLQTQNENLYASLQSAKNHHGKMSHQLESAEQQRQEAREEVAFIRTLYDRASEAAAESANDLRHAENRVRQLESQLADGLDAFRTAARSQRLDLEGRLKRSQDQVRLLLAQAALTDDEIRSDAQRWREHVAEEKRAKKRAELEMKRLAKEREERKDLLSMLAGPKKARKSQAGSSENAMGDDEEQQQQQRQQQQDELQRQTSLAGADPTAAALSNAGAEDLLDGELAGLLADQGDSVPAIVDAPIGRNGRPQRIRRPPAHRTASNSPAVQVAPPSSSAPNPPRSGHTADGQKSQSTTRQRASSKRPAAMAASQLNTGVIAEEPQGKGSISNVPWSSTNVLGAPLAAQNQPVVGALLGGASSSDATKEAIAPITQASPKEAPELPGLIDQPTRLEGQMQGAGVEIHAQGGAQAPSGVGIRPSPLVEGADQMIAGADSTKRSALGASSSIQATTGDSREQDVDMLISDVEENEEVDELDQEEVATRALLAASLI